MNESNPRFIPEEVHQQSRHRQSEDPVEILVKMLRTPIDWLREVFTRLDKVS